MFLDVIALSYFVSSFSLLLFWEFLPANVSVWSCYKCGVWSAGMLTRSGIKGIFLTCAIWLLWTRKKSVYKTFLAALPSYIPDHTSLKFYLRILRLMALLEPIIIHHTSRSSMCWIAKLVDFFALIVPKNKNKPETNEGCSWTPMMLVPLIWMMVLICGAMYC